jgi:hypothetical protein
VAPANPVQIDNMNLHRSSLTARHREASATYVRGVRVRTMLEAAWASLLTAHGALWLYDAGTLSTGARFYLPASRQTLVVRSSPLTKIVRASLLRQLRALPDRLTGPTWEHRGDSREDPPIPDVALVIVGASGSFYGLDRNALQWESAVQHDLSFCRCVKCDGWYFCATWHSWRCQCCGWYDGNADVHPMHASPLSPWTPGMEDVA